MKKTQKTIVLLLSAMVAIMFIMSSTANAQQAKAKPWPVPDKYKTMKPTVKLNDPAVIANGKDLWAKNCKSFQSQTDGEIYYKTSIGRDEMPSYEKKIPDVTDHWALVAYMRTLKK